MVTICFHAHIQILFKQILAICAVCSTCSHNQQLLKGGGGWITSHGFPQATEQLLGGSHRSEILEGVRMSSLLLFLPSRISHLWWSVGLGWSHAALVGEVRIIDLITKIHITKIFILIRFRFRFLSKNGEHSEVQKAHWNYHKWTHDINESCTFWLMSC